jgi:hypothetical protein
MKTLVLLLVGGALSTGSPLAGQFASTPESRSHDVVDSTAVVAALSLRLASGTGDDPVGREGLTYLAVDALRRALLEVPGVMEVEAAAARSDTRLTVVVRPGAFADIEARIDDPASLAPGIPAARRSVVDRFAFTAETPRHEMELEAARLLAGFDDPWSRPASGTPASVPGIDDAAIVARWSALLEARSARVRVGPPGAFPPAASDTDTGRDAAPEAPGAASALPDTVLPDTAAPVAAATPAASVAPPWIRTDRVRIVRDVTNLWIVVAFPLPPDLERTSVDHLVHRIDEILHPVPGDPGLIGAEVEVVRLPEGEAIVVTASVLPPSATTWEARIVGIPDRISPPFDPDFFRWERRRFRAHLLLRDAPIGHRAARIASDLFTGGDVRDLAEEAWALEPDDLANAAGRLGPPRILVFGPDVSERF